MLPEAYEALPEAYQVLPEAYQVLPEAYEALPSSEAYQVLLLEGHAVMILQGP